MIQILNNIFYYLNVAALLHSQHENNTESAMDHGQGQEFDNGTAMVFPPILLKQIPPGPILPGVMVKFVCAMEGSSNNSTAGCINASETNNSTAYQMEQGIYSYQWEMYQYVEDKDGNVNNANVVTLPARDSEMEMEFNESVADPKTQCDLVCTIKNNPRPSNASIKLHFLTKDIKIKLTPPTNFKVLDVTGRAVYFSWKTPQRQIDKSGNGHSASMSNPQITGYIIEYKNGKGGQGFQDWISRYEIKKGDTHAACITNLAPWTTYHFRILSISNNASSNPSPPIIARTLEDLPSAPPVDVKMTVQQNVLEVTWKPPPRPTWNGALLGYNIGLRKASSPENDHYVIYVFSPLESLGNYYSYQITVADASNPYKVVVQAFNNIGSGPFSSPVNQEQKVANEGN